MDQPQFDIWNWISAGIGSALSAVWLWFRQRKRDAAEIRTAEIENVEKAIEIWRNLAQDMRAQVDKLTTQVNDLTTQVIDLRNRNEELKQKVLILEEENIRLESVINQMSK